jgi:hypothetical protein
MFKPRKAARPFSDPSETRFRQSKNTRKRFGLTVRQVADLLDKAEIATCLSEFERQTYRRLASNNETKIELARLLGFKSMIAVNAHLQRLEKEIIQRALFVGERLQETSVSKAVEMKGKVHEDHLDFEEDERRRIEERQQRMERAHPNDEDKSES